jgi:tetratricopeptide (TPR) repeat protein
MLRRRKFSKRLLFSVLAVSFMIMFLASGIITADDSSIIDQANKLTDDEKYEESNKILMDLVKNNSTHPDLYWNISRNFYNIGERMDIEKNKAGKLDMYVKAEQWAEKGYKQDPDLADNAFWMAVGMSQQAQTKGIASTLMSDRTLAKRIEQYYVLATKAKNFHYVEKNANTPSSAHFALGQFYRKVPDFFVIKLLMGTQGDIDKSVEHVQKAVEMFPDSVEFNKELGVSYMCRNEGDDMEKAKKHLNKVLTLPADSKLDEIDQADSKKLLADPSMACGYGRVQQEDMSENAFKE